MRGARVETATDPMTTCSLWKTLLPPATLELWGVHWGRGWARPCDGHLAFWERKGPAAQLFGVS